MEEIDVFKSMREAGDTKIITDALLYHTIQYLSIERITIMDDPDLNAMRQLIAYAVSKCNDLDFLKFIYQLVTKSNRQS